MRKFLIIAIPIISLVLFICIMLSTSFLKRSFGKNDNVPQVIENIIQDVNNEAWDEVNTKVEDLNKAWRKVIHRIQFSSERDEIDQLSTNIARLRGAALAKDKVNSLIELKEAYSHWVEVGE